MVQRLKLWLLLLVVAAIPRLLGAFFLPNTFGDAYVYIRDIGTLSTRIKAGTFAITDLYGFWLPLYQFIAAIVNVFVGNGFYVGKIVSSIFGIGVCLLVYALTFRITGHRGAALLSFLVIALNPLHILTSTSALTDVPHAFFVLAGLYFVLRNRWIVAAIFVALAGLTRVESWMFIALIPLVQLWRERQISIPAVAIMFIPPLFWFYVSWKATGDWLACFKARQQYHDWLLAQNPALAHFSPGGVLKNIGLLVSGAEPAVLCAAFAAAWLVLRQITKRSAGHQPDENVESILPVLGFFFAFFAMLIAAYLTHQQPIIFPRYGLILFSLGIPILAWIYLVLTKRRPQWARRILAGLVVACALNFSAQTIGAIGELKRYSAQRAVTDYLRDHFDQNSKARIFCDEGTVLVLSGIPSDRFVSSAEVPKDRDGFLSALAEQNVEWLVVARQPGSTPPRLFPDSEYGQPIGPYQSVMTSRSLFWGTDIQLYRRESSR
jgi:hypothetical protein